ncbi:MAG: hypothetical protein N2Z72_05630 [Bacteroidales bacterium]|nr:hypothetical protein [Bacteroidales bacterium]
MNSAVLKGYVVVPYFFNSLSDKALKEGKRMAQVFGSHLIIFGCGSSDEERYLLSSLAGTLINDHYSVTSYLVEKNKWKKMFYHFSSNYDVVMLIYAHNTNMTQTGRNLRKEISSLRRQRSPFLMVNERVSFNDYSKIVLMIDFSPLEKEKILWASYFARKYHSLIYVLVPEPKDMFLKVKIQSNLQSLEKLYNNLSLSYEIVSLRTSYGKSVSEGLLFAKNIQAGCFLHLTSGGRDIFSILEGDTDVRTIREAVDIPILCINPRDDLYVLCQ